MERERQTPDYHEFPTALANLGWNRLRQQKLAVLDGLLGGPRPLWNTLLVGVVVGLLALIRASNPTENAGLSWTNLIVGLWLIVSPFILPYGHLTVAIRNDVVIGIVVGVLAIWSAVATPTRARSLRPPRYSPSSFTSARRNGSASVTIPTV